MTGHRRSMRSQLLRALVVLSLTLVGIAALAVVALRQLGGAIGLILRENYVSVVACMEMNEALEREDSAAQFTASGRDDIGLPMLRAERPLFDKALALEAANITLPGEGELVAAVTAQHRGYVAAVDHALALPAPERSAAYFNDLLPRFRALKEKITAIRLLNQGNMEAADTEARALARRTQQIAIAVTVVALLVAAWLGGRILRSVLAPIAALTERARRIGDGRFDESLPLPAVAELAALAEATNRMQERLRAYRESSLGELLAAKDLSRATVASMPDPVLVFAPRGEVLLANEAAEAIFDLHAGDGRPLSTSEGRIPEPIALARDRTLASGAPELPASLAEAMRWVGGDGERWFLVRAAPVRTDDGVGALVIAQEVTRFRRIDALKSDVVATVSHELKTPLTGLRLATHMLLETADGALDDTQRELAETARDETERLQRTVDELLDLVRIEREAGALHRTPTPMLGLCNEVAAAHRALAEAADVTIAVEVEGEGAPAGAAETTVDVDAEQMTIALGNLVSNAVRHSRAGAVVRIVGKVGGGMISLSVIDQGEGISPEHLPQVFERHARFGEPANLRGRHGLGLAIARDIVQRHEGTLEASSTVGRGSTFTIRLPLATTPIAVSHAEESSAPSA
jgi:NtrC-family two-component system sensor histidine kinase KinB